MKVDASLNKSFSTVSILKIVGVLATLYLLFLISDIIGLLFASFILASAISPWVNYLHKLKIPRAIGVLIIYLLLFAFVAGIVYLIVPAIISEAKELSNNLPRYINEVSGVFGSFKDYAETHNLPINFQQTLNNLTTNMQGATTGLINTVTGFFGGIFSCFLVLVITFYMIVEEESLQRRVWTLVSPKKQTRVLRIINDIQQKIGLWFRGQLLLCFIVFLLTYMSLLIFDVKYALILAIIAGLLEAIPYFGPTLSSVPAIFIALAQSPLLALFILFVYVIIQTVENNILVPKIMQRAVGLDPIISIISLMIGFKLGGILGALLAIPIATSLLVITKDLFLNYEKKLS